LKSTLLTLSLLFLTACGGGGGSSGPAGSTVTATPTPTATVTNVISLVTNQLSEYSGVMNWVVGDLNNDGLDDVVHGGWAGPGLTSKLSIFIQNADGTMTDQTTTLLSNRVYDGSQHILINDFDNDGRQDIWVPGFNDGCTSGCQAKSLMLWGSSTGVFTRQDFTQGVDSHGACVADINGDGFLDMIVRSAFVSGQVGSGAYYINNKNRTFTYTSNSAVISAGSTCSVIKQANGNMAILQGNVGMLTGFASAINIVDSNLNLVTQIGVKGQTVATDLINSIAMDVNNDGAMDFVLVFNQIAPGVPGAKEVWLNNGFNSYSYAYRIDMSTNNQYSMYNVVINGLNLLMFDGPNGNAQLFNIANNQFNLYNQDKFTAMATEAGGKPFVNDWSIRSGLVYTNKNTGKIYMMQNIKGLFYTKSM
jgi:hypothetical protein